MARWLMSVLAVALAGCELVAGIPDAKPLQLESLDIIGGAPAPAFAPTTLHYTDNIGDDEILDIDAFANDQKATVSVTTHGIGPSGSGSVDATINDVGSGSSFTVDVTVASPVGVSTTYTIEVITP